MAAHIEANVELTVLLVFTLWSNLDMRPRDFEISFFDIGLRFDVAENISRHTTPCLSINGLGRLLLILTVLNQAE